MPVVIPTIDDIMARQQRDTFFVRFKGARSLKSSSRPRHLEWFDHVGLRYELAAPRGWLEGDPGVFVVYFDGLDDPRVRQYSDFFEDAEGRSLAPEEYQMVLLSYGSWLNDSGRPT